MNNFVRFFSKMHRDQVKQVVLSSVLMFATGSTFALGVFTVPVELWNQNGKSFLGVWPFGMGLMHFLSAPVLIITGLILDYSKQHNVHNLLKACSLAGAVAFICFAICSVGLLVNSRVILIIGLAIQSLPLGIYYPLVTEHLLSWIPSNPGFAVGISQLAFGLGSILVAWFFSVFIDMFGAHDAIIISAACLGTMTLVSSFFLAWPQDVIRQRVTDFGDAEDQKLLVCKSGKHFKLVHLLSTVEFWLYIIVVLTAGVSYAFIPYYFKLGGLFNVSSYILIMSFQATSIASTVFGMLTSIWTENFSIGDSGIFSSGAKNMMGLFLFSQTVLFILLIVVSRLSLFIPFVLAVGVLKMIMASHAGCAALVARDIFGERNSCLTFGIGGGLALGGGEGISAALMTFVESRFGPAREIVSPSDFEAFFWIAGLWSAIGTICLLSLQKYRKAFEV